jgi:catechol 2,3-dioxygenase-like lactoylglutathione lyase family enzyme
MTADIQNTVPVLPSLDLQQSIDFYTTKLGFREVGRYPNYAIVSREGAKFTFGRVAMIGIFLRTVPAIYVPIPKSFTRNSHRMD